MPVLIKRRNAVQDAIDHGFRIHSVREVSGGVPKGGGKVKCSATVTTVNNDRPLISLGNLRCYDVLQK